VDGGGGDSTGAATSYGGYERREVWKSYVPQAMHDVTSDSMKECCELRPHSNIESRYIRALAMTIMELMQGYPREDGAVGVEDLYRLLLDKSVNNVEVMRVATVADLVVDEIETAPEGSIASEGERLYNIEKIVGHKIIKKVRYYRIKWEGYPSSENTWEPVDVLEDCGCLELVEEYHRNDECRRKTKKRRRS
jgi:hypothetical protein